MWHNHFYHLYTVPFNLLRSFKDGVHRSNLFYIILVSDTHACHRFRVQKVCQLLFAYVYCVRSACSVLRVCLRRKRVASAFWKNLSMPATFSWRLFAPFCTRNVLLTWVSDTRAWTLQLVLDTHAWTLPVVSDTQTPSLAPVSVL